MAFQWAQFKHAIYPRWKKITFDYSNISKNNLCQNHHFITGTRILPLDKLSSKEIYSILIQNIVNKPTSNIYFEKLFENTTLDSNKIYLSPRLQSVSGRNRCLCCSSHVLCYGRVQSCVIHNYFASYNGNIIRACRSNKADRQ